MCYVTLARIYQRGFAVDLTKLENVRQEFEQEKCQLIDDLQVHVRKVWVTHLSTLTAQSNCLGLSMVVRLLTSMIGLSMIDPYMPDDEFQTACSYTHTNVLYRTNAVQCPTCNGSGTYARPRRMVIHLPSLASVLTVMTSGFCSILLTLQAGFKFKPPTAKWASANGFTTSKGNLELLEAGAKSKGYG